MTAQPALRLPDGHTPADFLARHWQKHPLFLPDALPDFQPPLSVDEIAGLACEPGVESRLVFTERRADGVRYRAETGPFAAEYLASLPGTDWTLLVHDLDRHLPELRSLLLAPRLLPAWRLGDLMASVAAPGGSVGPHRDSYDVFLLQGEGERRWQLGSGDPAPTDSGLRLLHGFRADEEYLCRQGDALYVPPGAGHHGVAETLCSTWSLGLQAPLVRDLAVYLDLDTADIDSDRRYADPDLGPEECRGGIIHPAAVRRCREALGGTPEILDDDIAEALGRLVTLPKPDYHPHPATRAEAVAIATAAAEGRRIRAAPCACFRTTGGPVLFAAGETFPLPESAWPLACRLAGPEGAEGVLLDGPVEEAERNLLFVLARQGLIETPYG